MGLFKNDVGRPSNDILKKRKNIKIIIAVLVVAVVAGLSYFTYSYVNRVSLVGASKNVTSSGANLSIAGKNGGFIVNNKYYSKGSYVAIGSNVLMSTGTDKIGNSVVYVNSNGKTAINIKGLFGRDFIKKVNGSNSKLIIQTINSNGTVLSSNFINITKSTIVKAVTISSKVYGIKVAVFKQTNLGAQQVYSKTINVSTVPTVSQTFVDSARKTSDGVYAVSKNGDNRIKFNLKTTSGHTMYYSVFTFKNHSLSSSFEKRNATCVSFNKNITTPTYSVKVDSNNNKAISIRMYADKTTCERDSRATTTNSTYSKPVLKVLSVKYLPKYVTTNSQKYIVINPHYASEISKYIGHQTSGECLQYAFKYGAYVLKGSLSNGRGSDSASYGAYKSKYSTKDEFFKLIVNKINAGIPVILHTGNKASSTHWVTVIGYRPTKTETTDFNNLWIIDPWNNNQYGKKGSGTVFFGPSYKNGSVRTTMVNGLNGDRVYYTWSSRSSAK